MVTLNGIDKDYVKSLLGKIGVDVDSNFRYEIEIAEKGLHLNSDLYTSDVYNGCGNKLARFFIKDIKPLEEVSDIYKGDIHKRVDSDLYEQNFLKFHGLLVDYSRDYRRIVMQRFDGSFDERLSDAYKEYMQDGISREEKLKIRGRVANEARAVLNMLVIKNYERTKNFKTRDANGRLLVEQLGEEGYRARLGHYLSTLLDLSFEKKGLNKPKGVEYVNILSEPSVELERLVKFLSDKENHTLIQFDSRSPNIVWNEKEGGLLEFDLVDYGNAGLGRFEVDVATFTNDYLLKPFNLEKRLREYAFDAMRKQHLLMSDDITFEELTTVNLGNILEGERLELGERYRFASIWSLLKSCGFSALFELNFKEAYNDFIERYKIYDNEVYINSRLDNLIKILGRDKSFSGLKECLRELRTTNNCSRISSEKSVFCPVEADKMNLVDVALISPLRKGEEVRKLLKGSVKSVLCPKGIKRLAQVLLL